MRNRTWVPIRAFRSSPRLTVAWEAGTNTRMAPFKTITPPLTTSITLPVRISPLSWASWISSQPFMASTRRLESMMVPSWSLVFIMSSSISSPIFTTSSGLTEGSLESSAAGINPACLRPTST